MARFTVNCELLDLTRSRQSTKIAHLKVGIRSKYTWLPENELRAAGVTVAKKGIPFVMPNGATITRDIGYAYLRSGDFETVDEVVFARPTDLPLLGARTLQGFAARIDPRAKRLLAAEPLPVAAAPGTSRGSSAESNLLIGRRRGARTMTTRQEDYIGGLTDKRSRHHRRQWLFISPAARDLLEDREGAARESRSRR